MGVFIGPSGAGLKQGKNALLFLENIKHASSQVQILQRRLEKGGKLLGAGI
jgi:hypothetical protein